MHGNDACYRYIPISERDRAWGIFVTCGGYVRIPPGGAYPPDGHPEGYRFAADMGRTLDEYQLHYIARGRGGFSRAPGLEQPLEAGTAFLLFPGVWHNYRPDPTVGWDEWWIGLDGDQAERVLDTPFFGAERPLLPVRDDRRLIDRFTELVDILQEDPPELQRLLGSLALLLLGCLQVAEAQADLHGASNADAVRAAKRRIAADPTAPLDGHRLARELGVGYHWLRRAFRRHTGFSMTGYRTQLLFQQAMRLLDESDLDIKQVALRL
ncbi:MAG: AraC family transcriptional regulator, partial [Planctomycetota bacterium]